MYSGRAQTKITRKQVDMVACVPHDYMSEVVRTVCCGEMQRCKVVLVRFSIHGLRGVPYLRESYH